MGKTFQRVGLGVATGGISETAPLAIKAVGSVISSITGALTGKSNTTPSAPAVDPALANLKAQQEAQTAADTEQAKKRAALLSSSNAFDFSGNSGSFEKPQLKSVLGGSLS